MLQKFIEIIKSEIPEADDIEIAEEPRKAIRISWKTNDDDLRPSKRFQPIVIELYKDIELPTDFGQKIYEEFAAFIRNKRANFKPRTTENRQKSHTADFWVFPPEY